MVDCNRSPEDDACEKPVSSVQKTVIPVCIFVGILLIAIIVFLYSIRRRARLERQWEQQARAKYENAFNNHEPHGKTDTNVPGTRQTDDKGAHKS
ncbi:uncharacterized protein BKCO1_5000025 [Diplodia corticola]|uniref:Uncharacterized protein n=1 Tax=Diplodia corticola TaxID=236234 RepID=A0A1J9QTJ8_9PEZI|nr:uncharacterized protein BKCO1_5000025 [Diplodia corticola]OJD31314.1 hypothetical protein BKCO1_5000025 [Diplodia corticola]